jgi:hypothetical protein
VIDPDLAITVAYRAAAAALAVGFLEQLRIFTKAFGDFGPFSTAVSRALTVSRIRHLVSANRVRYVLCLGAAAAIAAFILGPLVRIGCLAGALAFVCVLLVKFRRVTASDGAEQMALLTILAICLGLLPGYDRQTLELAVWFIAAQSILSYGTAGVAKAVSPVWRRGEAVALIMGSESHGHRSVSGLLQRYSTVSRLLSRGTIVFECAFPLVLVAPQQFTALMLATGLLFHASCAVTMGLNTFLLVFPGTYLCVAYVAQHLSPVW